ncbi:ornithine carbamoyltransferase [Luteococcus sp. OSA5]|uniref:ornithine carbamoyltransferase n=1 Tax=Luteococcus sp. OSA5 TaxID=3401630 RepID=UPI003B435369
MTLKGRHFLKEADFTPAEWLELLDLAAELKQQKKAGRETQRLAGKNIALIFEKTSTRTRCSFEVAAADQGAHTTYLEPTGSQIGHKESMADTARVLGRMFDGIEYRGFGQEGVEVLAAKAGVPVWNGLTNEWHPTQMLADQLTMREHCAKPLHEVTHAYLGDARYNMGNSCLVSGAIAGMDIRIVAPAAFQPEPWVVEIAQTIAKSTGARITITDDVAAGVKGCDFVSTDVWVSMGEVKEVWQERIDALKAYQVNADVMAATGNPDARFLHCLPAFHDRNTTVGEEIFQATGMEALEVSDEVFEGPQSVVFDQAENRMHTIKAVMVATLGE